MQMGGWGDREVRDQIKEKLVIDYGGTLKRSASPVNRKGARWGINT
jgi:hypothetical protein